MKFVKNVLSWKNEELIIVDVFETTRCYACGGETRPDQWHPTLHRCESGHIVEIPCTDWFIVFAVREKKEIKIKKHEAQGKTKVGRGSWTPESENDTNLKFNEQLLRFDHLHVIDNKELFGIYLTDFINVVATVS
jgi:hypothetical protein